MTSGLKLFSPPVSDAVLDVLAPCSDYTDRVIRLRRFVTSIDKKRRQSNARKIFWRSHLQTFFSVITFKARFMVGAMNALHLLSLSLGIARSLGKVNAFRKHTMSRIDIDSLAAKLRVLTKRTKVAVSTRGHIDNIKEELATGILRLATDSAQRHHQLNRTDAEHVANRTAESFFRNFDKNIHHPFPKRLIISMTKNKAADHFRQVDPLVDEYVSLDSPDVEPYTKAHDKTPFCLTVTSQVLDAVEDGRIKGRAANGIFMILNDETNLGNSDRQACTRAREKLRDVFGEESSLWG